MNILLIEDDPDDVELLEFALTQAKLDYRLNLIADGRAAITHIHSADECPDIIILDLNLPAVSGRELLPQIKKTDRFREVPVLVFTTSSAAEDKAHALANGAFDYVVKPSRVEQFDGLIKKIMSAQELSECRK